MSLSQVRLSFLLGWILPYNTILRRTWHCLLMLWEAVKSIGARAANHRETISRISGICGFLGRGDLKNDKKMRNLTNKNCCLGMLNQQILDMDLFNKWGYLSLWQFKWRNG